MPKSIHLCDVCLKEFEDINETKDCEAQDPHPILPGTFFIGGESNIPDIYLFRDFRGIDEASKLELYGFSVRVGYNGNFTEGIS